MKKFSELKTRNKIFFGTVIFEILFIIGMWITFWVKDTIPDTLVNCVLGAGGAISGITGGLSLTDIIIDGIRSIKESGNNNEEVYESQDPLKKFKIGRSNK